MRSHMPTNSSGISPCGHRILVAPIEIEEKTESGIVLARTTVDQEQMAQMQGIVVEVGPTAWADCQEPWAKEGDKVIFGKYAGFFYTAEDGKKYRVINDLDVVAAFK